MIPKNPAAGPAGADEHTWFLNMKPSGFPSLTYASLDERDIVFDLWCRWRGSVIAVRLPGRVPDGSVLEISSGNLRSQTGIHSGSRELELPFETSGIFSENDEVLRRFGLTGQLTIRRGERSIPIDSVTDGELQRVRRFFELCYFERPNEPDLPWR